MRKISLWLVFLLVSTFNFQLSTFNCIFAAERIIDDFKNVEVWSDNQDGGTAPEFSLSKEYARDSKNSLKLVYTNPAKGWGNIKKETTMTGKEKTVDFWLYKESSNEKAAMHIWLFEEDGDGWVTGVKENGKIVGAMEKGWHRISIPIKDFAHQPRGDAEPNLSSVNRIYIGCNYGDMVVYVSGLKFDAGVTQTKIEEKKVAQDFSPAKGEDMKKERVSVETAKIPSRTIGIFKDKVPAVESKSSDPDYLNEVLKKAGFQTKFLKGEELANPEILNKDNVEILILPYGSSFPAEATENLKKYLKAGGSFFSTGGYTFDNLYSLTSGKAEGGNFITNSGFEEELEAGGTAYEGLSSVPAGVTIERDDKIKHQGKFSLRYEVPGEVQIGWFGPVWKFEIRDDIKEKDVLKISAFVKTKDVYDGAGAYIATNYYKANGERISWDQSAGLKGTNDWSELKFMTKEIPAGTSHMTVNILLYGHGVAWFDEVKAEKSAPGLNTRAGKAHDSLEVTAEQIPVFDAGYRLENAVSVKSNPDQFIIDKNVALKGEFKGYAASAMTAPTGSAVFPSICRRWIPLLKGYDKYDRLRGTAGALVYNYKGTYRKSAWTYFGVNNEDIFQSGDTQMAKVFIDTINHIRRKTFLHDLSSNYVSYRQGEEVEISVKSSNQGYEPQKVSVKMQVTDYDGKKVYFEETQNAELGPGDLNNFTFVWKDGKFDRDLYRFCAMLSIGGKPIDMMESGFCVWDEKVLQGGLKITWDNSYFYVNGKPFFFCGTNYTGVVFFSDAENPLVLERDFQKMQDNGMTCIRVLHFGVSRLFPDLRKPKEKVMRRLDALLQLCQKHNVVLLQTVHDWMDAALQDKELDAQKEFARMLSARYQNVTGLRWDIQNEPSWGSYNPKSTPDINREYNAYLQEKYGTTNKLKEAWGERWVSGELGSLSFDAKTGDSWDDIKAYDLSQFRRRLFNRWINANYEGLKETSKYNVNVSGATIYDNVLFDNVECMGMHGYIDIGSLPQNLKYIDQRFRTPFGLEEFGQKVHPAWGGGNPATPKTFDEGVRHFLAFGHYVLGLGGYGLLNWDWKDMEGCIFPWGINFPCDVVSKPILPAFRNMSLFFRSFTPKYTPPELYLLIPVNHEMGKKGDVVRNATLRALRFLIDSHLDFGVIDELNLDKLPRTAKVIMYPLPFCPDDLTYNRIKEFVSNGGVLYISGDISYDTFFKRTKTDRLKELCGVEFQSENYPNIEYSKTTAQSIRSKKNIPDYDGYPCIRVKPKTAQVLGDAGGEPVIFENNFGKGKIFYTTDVYELNGSNDNRLYKAFLSWAGIAPNEIKPDDSKIHIFKLATTKDETLYVLFNTDTEKDSREVTFNLKDKPVTMTLGKLRPGAVLLTKDGKVRAIEAQGKVKIGDEEIADLQANAIAFSLDNEDLRLSNAIAVLPVQSGKISLKIKPGLEMEIGEVHNGRWNVYDVASQINRDKTGSEFSISDYQKDCIFLLTSKQDKEKYRKIFEDLVSLK